MNEVPLSKTVKPFGFGVIIGVFAWNSYLLLSLGKSPFTIEEDIKMKIRKESKPVNIETKINLDFSNNAFPPSAKYENESLYYLVPASILAPKP